MISDRETTILEVAQDMVRQGGYNSFSFRSIATAVGIKSSSVHYHFSTKEDLGVAVAKFYTDNFMNMLGDPADMLALKRDPIEQYTKIFRNEVREGNGMCLCGMLGAESKILPERVMIETRQFFQRNIEWLENAYILLGRSKNEAHRNGIQIISLLEGAMITSNTMSDFEVFEQASKIIAKI